MKLIYPVEPHQQSQGYSGNANPSYGNAGLKGHGAIDFLGYYGEPIFSSCDAYLYSNINFGQSPDRYRAVYTLVDDGDFVYEVSYGHVIDSPVPIKTYVKQGQVIARMGNFGTVYLGNHLVTNEEKLNGSQQGTHLHFQIRKCIKVSKTKSDKHYIKDSNGYVRLNDMYIEILDYGNGYNGCIDPIPFFGPPPFKFTRDLYFGMKGEDVRELQKFLNTHGYFVINNPTDYFGSLTKNALVRYQLANNISPPQGYFGPLTRGRINEELT